VATPFTHDLTALQEPAASSRERAGPPRLAAVERPLRILHVIIMLGETNSQYNEHCLPLLGVRDLSIGTYFPPRLTAPEPIAVFPGDGTLRGFFRAFRRAITAKSYDVVHVHAPQTAALVLVALAGRPRRLRTVRRSLVYTVHDSFYDYKRRDQLLMLPAFVVFRRIVFCGNAAFQSYPALWKRLAAGRARVVPNSADLERVERAIAGVERPAGGSSFHVVSVGRLEKVKDPATVVEAFRRIGAEGTRLSLVGAGPLESELAASIREPGMDGRVELTGLIPRDEVFVRFAQADLFISSSRGEGLPVAVIEAMAAGCPAVLSDIAPHRELVGDADFVPLVRPGDVDGFAREIERFREMSPDVRAGIGRRCRDLVRERFALSRMHAGYEQVYRELT
jgi:glycosyltransferase involved in cell wall biosynthesis